MKPYMKIRWNSTFLMLKSCRNHTVVITAFVNAKSDCGLTHSDWIITFEYMKFSKTKTNFAAACIDMESKFKKYFEDMPKIFAVAVVMDPRTKLEDVQMLLEGISDNLMITLPSCTKVKSQLTNLYASYESKFASSTTTTSTTTIPLTSTSNNDPS
ncbi:hypothetical protein RHMOL_Rhmol02G0174900 [Rhododendron molle]|uniref:Uncharacterized protein n=1 Tax=Rhododendron molle TaxID=49168 RepID=A0ACC0PR21_RHOML|nr:hypothetical protein RHMOL_Rhmol02G0174900 [Rhododendron molle]